MAGMSVKAIRNRIKSMESTRQITKAMEMVAASRMIKAEERIRSTRPYFAAMYDTLTNIAANNDELDSEYLKQREVKKACYIVIAGDRGLAGGYNSGVLKLAYTGMAGQESCVLPIGKKAVEFFKNRGIEILTEEYAEAANVSISDCFTMARLVAQLYSDGGCDKVTLVYTKYISVLAQNPGTLELLPLLPPETGKRADRDCLIIYEPDSVTVFKAIIPEYLGGLIYGALAESVASELGARRTAMDNATKNADDMIADLNLKYNRARQGAITQEITEIVSGASG